LARIPFSAVVNRVNLEKAGFALVPGAIGADLDMLFQELPATAPEKAPFA
jgi:hypothetical protein